MPHMRGDRPAELGGQGGHCLLQGCRCGDGAQGIVTVGERRAEQRHGGVAEVLVDRAAVLRDDRIGAIQEGFDDPARGLGADGARELGEAADVGEEHDHLPSLGLGRSSGRCRRLFRTRTEAGNRLDDPFAVTERPNAQLAQILGREPEQGALVDVVVGEGLGIPTKAQLL